MYYYVNDATRLVRTADTPLDLSIFTAWRMVDLADWNAFRLETKRMKRK